MKRWMVMIVREVVGWCGVFMLGVLFFNIGILLGKCLGHIFPSVIPWLFPAWRWFGGPM